MKCTIIPGDIGQKMSESIFRYKGVPYFVKEAGGKKIELYELDKVQGGHGPIDVIPFNHDDLDFSSVPLGYVNYTRNDWSHVVYISRYPVRKVKQGINNHNTRYKFLPDAVDLKPVSLQNVLFSKAFVDSVIGIFPSLESSLNVLRKNDKKEIAISRDIALSIDEQGIIKVYYKNKYVGWIQPDKFTVHVKRDDLGWVVSRYLSHVLGWTVD